MNFSTHTLSLISFLKDLSNYERLFQRFKVGDISLFNSGGVQEVDSRGERE